MLKVFICKNVLSTYVLLYLGLVTLLFLCAKHSLIMLLNRVQNEWKSLLCKACLQYNLMKCIAKGNKNIIKINVQIYDCLLCGGISTRNSRWRVTGKLNSTLCTLQMNMPLAIKSVDTPDWNKKSKHIDCKYVQSWRYEHIE